MQTEEELSAPKSDLAHLASDLRVVTGRLIRRLRHEFQFPLTQAAVLGRLERQGSQSIGQLAAFERVRPQSMSQTLADLEADGLVARSPDEHDGRRAKIELTEAGRAALYADRTAREGWLTQAISTFTAGEQETLRNAVDLLRRLGEMDQ
jgi:DNA-binding MarR family transcriptional regulator